MEFLRALPDDSQDVVIAFDVIEHFTRSELLPFTDEVRRVLRKDGRWLIHAPNGESPFIGRIFHGDFTHEQAFTQNSLKQLLFASQFSSVQCFEDLPIAHGLKSGVRRVLWKAIRSVLRFCIVAETGDAATSHILSQNFLTVARR
jgi:SAM-dependent methyltransferase